MPVFLVTAVLVVYVILSVYWANPIMMLSVYMLSPFLVIWMVYRVLKDGVPSDRTFDEYFYDDVDKQRFRIKEQSENPEYFTE